MTLFKVLLLSTVVVFSQTNGAGVSDNRTMEEDYDFCEVTKAGTVPLLSSNELLQKIDEINQQLPTVAPEYEKVLEVERDALIAALEASYEETTVYTSNVAPYMNVPASTEDRICQITERIARIEGMLRSPEVSVLMRADLFCEQNALRAEYNDCIGVSTSSSSNSRRDHHSKPTGEAQIQNWLNFYGIADQFSLQFPGNLLILKGLLDPVSCSSSTVYQPVASFRGNETIDDYLQLILRAFEHPGLSSFGPEFQVELNMLSCILYDLRGDASQIVAQVPALEGVGLAATSFDKDS